jgi:hypothetical protein
VQIGVQGAVPPGWGAAPTPPICPELNLNWYQSVVILLCPVCYAMDVETATQQFGFADILYIVWVSPYGQHPQPI